MSNSDFGRLPRWPCVATMPYQPPANMPTPKLVTLVPERSRDWHFKFYVVRTKHNLIPLFVEKNMLDPFRYPESKPRPRAVVRFSVRPGRRDKKVHYSRYSTVQLSIRLIAPRANLTLTSRNILGFVETSGNYARRPSRQSSPRRSKPTFHNVKTTGTSIITPQGISQPGIEKRMEKLRVPLNTKRRKWRRSSVTRANLKTSSPTSLC